MLLLALILQLSITTNRINHPETAEQVLADGHANMISMARPFLADAEIINKSKEGREDEINTCIGCNQACLDHVFEQKTSSCLVNPRACHETELTFQKTNNIKKVAVVGAGPAGLSAATVAAVLKWAPCLLVKETANAGTPSMKPSMAAATVPL